MEGSILSSFNGMLSSVAIHFSSDEKLRMVVRALNSAAGGLFRGHATQQRDVKDDEVASILNMQLKRYDKRLKWVELVEWPRQKV